MPPNEKPRTRPDRILDNFQAALNPQEAALFAIAVFLEEISGYLAKIIEIRNQQELEK